MERVMEQSVEEKEEVKGTSREPGALAGVYEVLSQRAIDEAIRIGVEAGTAAAANAPSTRPSSTTLRFSRSRTASASFSTRTAPTISKPTRRTFCP